MPLCNLHKEEDKLSTATCRPVTILLCGTITGTNSTNTVHSFSVIHQWVSESIRDPRGWRDGEWLNTFPNTKLLFSFCRWDAEGKGTEVTLAHTTSNLKFPEHHFGNVGRATLALSLSSPQPPRTFSITTQIRSYSHVSLTPRWNCFSLRYILFPSSSLHCQRSFYLSTRALQSNCKILQYKRAEVIWPRQLLFSSILQQSSRS